MSKPLPLDGQGAIVLPVADGYAVLTAGTRREIARHADAATLIQAAIDAQPDGGGSVHLLQGRYPLARPLALRSRLTLRGEGRATVLVPQGGCAVHGERIDGTTVAALMVDGGERGIVLADCGECHVLDCVVAGCRAYGIVLEANSFFCTVRGSTATGCGRAGILLRKLAKGRIGDYLPNGVHHCQVIGGGTGIECDNAVVVNIVGCSVFQATGAGYHLHSIANSVLISGCRTFQITGHALLVEGSQELNCTGNIFCWHTREGIRLKDVRWGAVVGNEVIDNGSFNPVAPDQTVRFDQLRDVPALSGIALEDCHGINVTGNTVFNWPQGTRMGVPIRESGFANTLAANYANYFTGTDAVRSEGGATLATANHGVGPEPHISSSAYALIQSFEPERTRAWLAQLDRPASSVQRPASGEQ